YARRDGAPPRRAAFSSPRRGVIDAVGELVDGARVDRHRHDREEQRQRADPQRAHGHVQDERGRVEGRENRDELVIPPLVRANEVDQIAANATRIAQMNVVFVSGHRSWGGSEELWSAAAAVLASEGHGVAVFKSGVDDSEPRMRRLRELGCRMRDLARFPLMPRRLLALVRLLSSNVAYGHEALRLLAGLALARRPDLVVVS